MKLLLQHLFVGFIASLLWFLFADDIIALIDANYTNQSLLLLLGVGLIAIVALNVAWLLYRLNAKEKSD